MSQRFLLGLGRTLGAVGAAIVVLGAAAPARAAGRVLVQGGTLLGPARARVAESVAPGWSTYWVSIEVKGGPGRFALVVPVPAGTAVDRSIDAWLEALDAATAPRVRPPKGVLACGATTLSSLEDHTAPHVATLAPTSVAVLSTPADVMAFAKKLSLSYTDQDETALGQHAGMSFVGVVYEASSEAATTETLRFVLPSGAPEPAFGLLGPGGAPEVVFWTVGEGRARASGAEEIEPSDLGVTWAVLQGVSDYDARRRQILDEKQGTAWIAEASGSTPLFEWNVLPSGLGAITPAVRAYIDLARSQGANVGSTESCLAPVWEAREQAAQGARVGRACAGATLALVPGGPSACDEKPGPGELGSGTLRCGEADDLAFALSGLLASEAKLTRLGSVVGSATPATVPVALVPGPSLSLLVTADEADTTGCFLGSGGSGGEGGFSGTGGYESSGGYGDTGGYGADDGYYVEEEPQTSVDVSCWTSSDSSGEDDSCGGDSSSSSDESDSCGGDSSSDSSEGDTCAGDSSDGSSEEGDTCSGDSSSSGEEGETCSADSGSGSEGDTCSGSSDSGGESCGSGSSSGSGSGNCTTGRVRPRIRVSALTLSLCALAFCLRRRSRRRTH